MAYVNPNVHEVYFAPGSAAFPSDGTGAIGAGISGKPQLGIKGYNPIRNDRFNIEIQQMQNVALEIALEQLDLANMKALLGYAKVSDVSAKIVTAGLAKSTNYTAAGGIFTFDNTKSLGIDLELKLTPKERAMVAKLERAFDVDTMSAIVLASDTDTLPGALSVPAVDFTKVIAGGMNGLLIGSISAIAAERINDWSIVIKTRSNKNQLNKSIVSGFDVEIMTKIDGVDPDEADALLKSQKLSSDVSVTIPMSGDDYTITLKKEALISKGEFDLDGDTRVGTLIWTGFYPADFIDLTQSDSLVFKAIFS
jgi:hypothetical protein